MKNHRYWIVGGEYVDTNFTVIVPGTERMMGPYATRVEAVRVWRQVSTDTRSSGLTRFTIAAEGDVPRAPSEMPRPVEVALAH